MPETPNFEQIARSLERDGWQDGQEGACAQAVDALRQVWNATSRSPGHRLPNGSRVARRAILGRLHPNMGSNGTPREAGS
jgi:hypothetical protein